MLYRSSDAVSSYHMLLCRTRWCYIVTGVLLHRSSDAVSSYHMLSYIVADNVGLHERRAQGLDYSTRGKGMNGFFAALNNISVAEDILNIVLNSHRVHNFNATCCLWKVRCLEFR